MYILLSIGFRPGSTILFETLLYYYFLFETSNSLPVNLVEENLRFNNSLASQNHVVLFKLVELVLIFLKDFAKKEKIVSIINI